MARAGSLFVNMVMRDASFIEGLKRATKVHESSMKKIGAAADTAALAIKGMVAGVVAGFGVAGIGRLAEGLASMGDEVSRFAQLANASTTDFQRMAAGAATVQISQEKLADVLKDVNDKFGDYAATGGGPLKDFFEKIAPKVGVTADQFARLSGPDALQLYVKSLQDAGVNQQQMTFYMEALANDATLLLPLLADNGAEMKRLGDEAQRAGTILSDSAIATSKELKTEMIGLKQAVSGVGIAIAQGGLAGLFRDLARDISAAASSSDGFVSKMRNVIAWARGLRSAIREDGVMKAFGVSANDLIARGRTINLLDDLWAKTFKPPETGGGVAGGAMAGAAPIVETVKAVAARTAEAAKSMAQLREEAVGSAGVLQDVSRSVEAGAAMQATSLEAMVLSAEQVRDIMGGSAWLNAMEQAQTFARGVSENLAQAIVYGRSIGDALVASFKAAAAEALANGLFRMLLGGGGGGGLLGGVFSLAGARANGGPVGAGRAYLVGERGPELFVPGVGGQIVSNAAAGGAMGGGGLLGGVFALAGARANGGPVGAGRAYLVGERGPELFMPGVGGQIVSNAAARGMGAPVIHVDARGSSDPAMVEIAARRGAAMALSTVADMARQGQRARLPGGRG